MSRRKFRPSISEANLFQQPTPEESTKEKPKPSLKQASTLSTLGDGFFQPPSKASPQESPKLRTKVPQRNKQDPATKQEPKLEHSSSLKSLTNDFFQAPTAEQSFGEDEDSLKQRRQNRRSSKRMNPVANLANAIPRQSSLEIRTSQSMPIEKQEEDPVVQLYEDYIKQLHDHISATSGAVPSQLDKIHKDLQNNVQDVLNTPNKKVIVQNVSESTSMIEFPSSENDYQHISESSPKRKHIFHSKWTIDTAQGSYEDGKLWWKAPQFILGSNAKSTSVRVTITQQDYHRTIGFYLFPINNDYRQLVIPNGAHTSSFNPTMKVQEVVSLDKCGSQQYALVVCSDQPGSFKLVVECKDDLLITNVKEYEEWQIRDSWDAQSAGGCRNHDSHADNPQYFLQSKSKSTIKCCASLHYTSTTENVDELGIYIVKASLEDADSRMIDKGSMTVLTKTEFSSVKQAVVFFELRPQECVVVVPCTFDKNVFAAFELDIFSTASCNMRKLSAPDCTSISGEWTSKTAGGCFNHPSWIDNQQYVITVNESIKIQLSQESTKHAIGFYVLKSNGKRILYASWASFVLKSKFTVTEAVSLELHVDPSEKGSSTYTIVPCTFNPQELGKFTLSVFNKTNRRMKLTEAEDPYTEKIIAGKWTQDSAGGCLNYATWRNNPQFEFSTPKDASAVVLLEQENKDPLSSIGAYILESSEPETIQWRDPSNEQISAKAKFRKSPSSYCHFDMKGDKYYNIVPCTFTPNQLRTFRLRVFTTCSDYDFSELENPALQVGRLCEGEWTESSSGGSMNNETWPMNPHYLLYTDGEESTPVTVVLSQKSKTLYPIGFSVTRADRYGLPHVEDVDDIVGRVSYEKNNDVFSEITLPASSRPYVITPSTFKPGNYAKFVLQVFADESADVMLMPWTSSVEFESDDDDDDEIYEEDLSDVSVLSRPSSESRSSPFRTPTRAENPFGSSSINRSSNDSVGKQEATYASMLELVENEMNERGNAEDAFFDSVVFGSDDDEEDYTDPDEVRDIIARLKDRIEFLEEESENFEDTESELSNKIESLQSEKKTIRNELEEKERELAKISTQLKEYEDKQKLHEEASQTELTRHKQTAQSERQALEKQLNASNRACKQLEEKLEASQVKRRSLKQTIGELTAKIEKLENKLDTAEQKNQEQEKIIQQAKTTERELQQKLQEFKERSSKEISELRNATNEKSSLEVEIKALQEKNDALTSEVQTFRRDIENKEAELKNRLSEVQNKKFSETQLKEQLRMKDDLLADLKSKLTSIEAIERELRERMEAKENELKELQREKVSLIHAKDDVERKVGDEASKVKEISKQLENREEKVKELMADLAEKKVEIVELKSEVSSSKTSVRDTQGHSEEMREQIEHLKGKITQTEKDYNDWKKESDEQKKKLMAEITTLQEETNSLKESNAKTQRTLAEKEKEIQSLKEKRSSETSDHEKLLEEYKEKISQLEDKLRQAHENEKKLQESLKNIPARVASGSIRRKGTLRMKAPPSEETPQSPSSNESPAAPAPPGPPPPSAPPAPKLGGLKKRTQSAAPTKSAKKKSVLTAIRGGVNLRKTKPENAGEKMKKSWIPFDVDKITQRREAMEEQDDDDSSFWSDEDSDTWAP